MEETRLAKGARWLLATQFLLGFQARLLPSLTPSASAMAYSHADAFRSALPFLPSRNGPQHTRVMGWMLGLGGACLLIPRLDWRSDRHGWASVFIRVGDALSVVLPGMFLWTYLRIGLRKELAFPLLNAALAVTMLWGRGLGPYAFADVSEKGNGKGKGRAEEDQIE